MCGVPCCWTVTNGALAHDIGDCYAGAHIFLRHTSITLIMFLGLRTIIYHVPDLRGAKAWYQRAFGVAPYFDEPFYVGFEVGGYELGLDPNPNGGASGLGGTTAYWGVPDTEAAVAHLLSVGATLIHDVQEVGGGIKVATVADPFGNEVGVIYNPHFKLP